MEKENITIVIRAKVGVGTEFDDQRTITVTAQRGDVATFLDQICEMIEANEKFEI